MSAPTIRAADQLKLKCIEGVDGKTIMPFYTARYCFSNFFPCPIELDGNILIHFFDKLPGHTFQSSEQCFMYRKAAQFNDTDSQQQLLKETEPKKCKLIGRAVKNFNKNVWDAISYDVSTRISSSNTS
jgi:ribA/ribD-fused uncharacterized protein